MAVAAATVWEVRAGSGNDSNGGGFVAGSGGTDYSQQNTAQATGTVTSSTTIVTATTGIFTSAMVGNYITDGTTWVHIVTFTSATQVTVDAAPGWTSKAIKVGGALNTITKLAALMVSSNKAYITGTETITASTVFGATGVIPGGTTPANHLIGYASTRGDNGYFNLSTSTSSLGNMISCQNSGWLIENFSIDAGNQSGNTCIIFSGVDSQARNCKLKNFTLYGVNASANGNMVTDCDIGPAVTSSGAGINCGGGVHIIRNYIHDITGSGISMNSFSAVLFNVITRCSIACISLSGTMYTIMFNTLDQSGANVISNATTARICQIKNNLITNATTNGIGGFTNTQPDFNTDGNAFFGNTSSNIQSYTASGVDTILPYTNVNDVTTLTTTPYKDGTTGGTSPQDWRLNDSPTGGALVRGTGDPGVLLDLTVGGNSVLGFPDMGCFQHQDTPSFFPRREDVVESIVITE